MKVLYFLTHPIQYQSPFLRYLAKEGFDLHVVYASDRTARAFFDEGYGRMLKWDVPLLEGYSHTALGHDEPDGMWAGKVSYFASKVRDIIHEHAPHVVWVHGWSHPFAVAARQAAQAAGVPVMMRGDTFLGAIRGGRIRRLMHRLLYTPRFAKIDAFLAIGTRNRELYEAYGVPQRRIFLLPHAVDNEFFQKRCAEEAPGRGEMRAGLGIPQDAPVLLFCGRLSDEKDPATLVRAVGRMRGARPPVLIMAGDGEQRPMLEALAKECAPGQVKFLGFRNQTELPALYDVCDVFMLPSVFEPWGLVVNEAMNAGRPVIVSDACGCWPDLVRRGINGDVFKAGSVDSLCSTLAPWIQDPVLRQSGGEESLRLVNQWGFREGAEGLRIAIQALAKGGRR